MAKLEPSISTSDDPELRRLLWYLLGGTRGGQNRARIIKELLRSPKNLNQLSINLKLHYRAIQHHMEVLRKNNLVTPQGERYGLTYHLNQWLEAHIDLFDEICRKLNFKFEDSAPGESRMSLAGLPEIRWQTVGEQDMVPKLNQSGRFL
ncbi:MAG: ArsR family transcriptional regulator [Nitrososphaerales archaeon]